MPQPKSLITFDVSCFQPLMENITDGVVLILGDGNFSFTGAFCRRLSSFGNSKVTVVSSVRETRAELLERYPECHGHVQWLEDQGIKLLFGLDATRLDNLQNEDGKPLRFDHVIFNFPHVGGKTNLRKSRQLIHGVFIACKDVLTADGRFYLTLAYGQSGLEQTEISSFSESDALPSHKPDSWQPLYLAAYGQFIVETRKPFLASEWFSFGYRCAGYKNSARRFHVENSQTLVFRQAIASASPTTLEQLQPEPSLDHLHSLRPFYVHDIAFWIPESFKVDLFLDAVRTLSKGLVKRITPLPQYSCFEGSSENGDKIQRVSLCFRFVWQSLDYALTREGARDLQLLLRDRLTRDLLAKHGMHIVLR